LKSVLCYPLFLIGRLLEHSDDHTTKIKLCGESFNACTRCLGAYISCFIFTLIFIPIYLTGYEPPFLPTLLFCYLLACFTIYDWVSIHAFNKKPNYKTIFISGFLLGLSAMLYLWLLPTPEILKPYEEVLHTTFNVEIEKTTLLLKWGFRLGTLIMYNLLAILLYLVVAHGEKT
jgi:uncharacterized membrane protein